jgi:putative methionine-R-sulfoxide reductase with GAF domain
MQSASDSCGEALLQKLRTNSGAAERELRALLIDTCDHFGCATGTIHRFDAVTGQLHLAAHHGLPAVMLERVATIPIGKGMAGLAAERRAPVQVCNLQNDASGVAKPGAKLSGMEGAIAVPMLLGGELRGVLGIAKSRAYDFSSAERETLLRAAEHLAACL